MSVADLAKAVARAAAICCLRAVAAVPAVAERIPFPRLRRLVATARLPDLTYAGIFPQAVYSPWRSDAEFRRAFAAVRAHTLVDVYRCYALWSLVGQAGKLPPGDILEVGAWRGGSGCLMALRSRSAGLAGTVYLCDTFRGVAGAGELDSAYVGGEHADASEATVAALARRLGLDNVRVLAGVFPAETAHAIERATFRLCHIDVDVHDSARASFDWVWPRLVEGGMVVFDDYGFYSCAGVTRFVNAIAAAPDRLVLYNLNGHAVVIKLA
ncbi:MAG TPA: TylF/MycF/NovP-related O-methyltransferase [Xanthobacteraceae bacterium]|nr:TylF/MycF/NovP-related O-methyltransferase [Xanthobacteraceae bacterium]